MMTAPEALFDLQKWTVRMLARPVRQTGTYRLPLYEEALLQEIETKISPGPHLTAAQRMGIYNQQFWFRMFVVLQDHYPTLTRLFGYHDFNHLIVEPYILKYLPDHWSLGSLGSRLPQWVEEEYHEEDRPLICKAALLDEAHERLFHVQRHSCLNVADLHNVIYLQPFVVLLELEGNLEAFRKELLEQEPEYWLEADFPKIDWTPRKAVLFRVDGKTFYEEVTQPQWVLLKAFEKGSSLSDACSFLAGSLASEAATQIGDWFQLWIQRGWLTTTNQKSLRS